MEAGLATHETLSFPDEEPAPARLPDSGAVRPLAIGRTAGDVARETGELPGMTAGEGAARLR
jgi:hypothetical protein